ncbi:replication-associated recombination protein A [Candidatus Daviesbacteria bacterium]|nr:replication-associated recombination protein A [Candidatus Daviesbacteria bacterium]
MTPLADLLRPKSLEEIVGQKHLLDSDKLLYKAIKNKQIFSMIFWGPPGVGKTTLARVIANELQTEFYEFSAVTTGIAELKKLFESLDKSKNQLRLESNSPVVFIDEIHRFNKAQQDAFLPYVENGSIILIGATTENPSFEVIGPLLSRTRVFVLNQLTVEELKKIIDRALKDKENGLGNLNIKLEEEAEDFLIEASNGDSRVMLNALEMAVSSSPLRSNNNSSSTKSAHGEVQVNKGLIEEALQQRSLLYDKAGHEHYNTISAFIKSMRASNVDAALHYLARMINAGEDPLFIARRMVIFASEDIGMAAPTALVLANEVFRACETIGYPECQLNLAHGVVYLASAKKDRSAHDAYQEALEDVKRYGNLPIPLNIRNAPTKLMKDLGYGKDYQMYTDKDLLPEKLKGKKYFKK